MTVFKPTAQSSPILSNLFVAPLIVALLLTAGCTADDGGNLQLAMPTFSAPVPPIQPVVFDAHANLVNRNVIPPPPLGPAVFVDFERRTYIPDRIVIPSIELDTPVVDVGWSTAAATNGTVVKNWDVAEFAAGWHINSNQLGQGGNVVLSGHNNLLGAVFREMDRLEAGDLATIWSGNIRYDYEIEEVLIVPELGAPMEQRRKNARWIGEFDDDRLTLVTCWPRDGNSHRIIAVGHLVGRAVAGMPSSSVGR